MKKKAMMLALLSFSLSSALLAQMVVRNSANSQLMMVTEDGKVALGGLGVPTPVEALEVSGGIRIANSSSTTAGTIRWDGTHFQGRLGSGWVNLNESQTLSLNGYFLSISQGNSVNLPKAIQLYAVGSPRNVLVTFNGADVNGIYTKDGIPTGITDPPGNGWQLVPNWSSYVVTSGSARGIIIPPALSNCPMDCQALSLRGGAFGNASSLFYLGYSTMAELKQMGDSITDGAAECNGLLFMDSSQNFYLMSQKQGDGVPERWLTHMWVTIFGGVR